MKALPVVVLALLGFAAFFMTFLVAPFAVLTIFYVVYAMRSSQPAGASQPAGGAPPAAPGDEPEVEAPRARRARVTVSSRAEREAAQESAESAGAAAQGPDVEPVAAGDGPPASKAGGGSAA